MQQKSERELQKNAPCSSSRQQIHRTGREDTLKQVYSRSKTEEVRITDKQREERQKGGERHKEKEKDEEKNTGRKHSPNTAVQQHSQSEQN